MSDLSGSLSSKAVECLNTSSEVLPVFQGKGAVVSDDDPQLLFNVGFNQPQRLLQIAFSGPVDSAPKDVDLFVNTPALAFDSAESYTPAMTLSLRPDQVSAGTPIPLGSAFSRVSTLSILVRSNQTGTDRTTVTAIKIVGPAAASGAAGVSHGAVKEVRSMDEFRQVLAEAGDKAVLVDFNAVWCGPCKMISPLFHALSAQHSTIVFLSVDVDRARDVAKYAGVNAMPTFQVYKRGQKVAEVVGADPDRLRAMVQEYA